MAGALPPFGAAPGAAAGVAGRLGRVHDRPAERARACSALPPTIDALRAIAQTDGGLEVHVTGYAGARSPTSTPRSRTPTSTLLLATGLLVLVLLLAGLPLADARARPADDRRHRLRRSRPGSSTCSPSIGLPVDSTSTSLLLVLMFGAGTDYCLLLVARYRAALRDGLDDEPRRSRRAPARGAGDDRERRDRDRGAACDARRRASASTARSGPVNAIGVADRAAREPDAAAGAAADPRPARVLAAHARGRPRTRRRARLLAPARRGASARRPARWLGRRDRASALVGCALGLSRRTTSDANSLQQFRTATDGTRGYDVLQQRASRPASLGADDGRSSTARDGPLRPPTSPRSRDGRARRRRAGVGDVTAGRRVDRRHAPLHAHDPFTDDPYGHAGAPTASSGSAPRSRSSARACTCSSASGSAQQVDFENGREPRPEADRARSCSLVVLLTLIVLLRALVAPLFLLATVIALVRRLARPVALASSATASTSTRSTRCCR